MEAEGTDAPPPFWVEPAYNRRRHSRRFVSGMSTFILSPMALVPVLLVVVVLISYIPSLLSPFSLLLRRALLFKSWDAFNFLLVLFAILAGILSRNSSGYHTQEDGDRFTSKLFEFSRKPENASTQREDEGREPHFRFYESKLDDGRLLVKEETTPQSKEVWFPGDHSEQKSEWFDSIGDRSQVRTPQKKTTFSHDVDAPKNEGLDPMCDGSPVKSPRYDSRTPDLERFDGQGNTLLHRKHSPSPPSRSPPPPLLQPRAAEVKRSRHHNKDPSMAALASVSSRKKDRKKKKKNKISEHVFPEIPAPLSVQPPPAIFHHFSTKPKEITMEKQRVPSAPVSIPPPPPAAPLHLVPPKPRENPRKENLGTQLSDYPSSFRSPSTLPSTVIKIKEKQKMEISSISSSSSSGRSLPPLLPPPPPPSLLSGPRILSENKYSARNSEAKREYQSGKSEKISPFCSTPDVNAKADKFIAQFREGIRLEKMQAMREKKGRHAKR